MGRPLRVLHVDDEDGFGEVTAEFLEREDDRFAVVTATSVDDALEGLATEHVDCVVSDYDMPGRDGLDLLDAVRETRPRLPFILFTGKGSEEVASDAIARGATDYLQKRGGTQQYELLAVRIRNAVDQYRTERERERIVERVTDAIVKVDAEWRVTFVDDRAEQLHGVDGASVLGRDFWDAFPDVEDTPLETAYRRVMGTRESTTLETQSGALGAWIHVEVYPDDDGGLSVYFQDITERKKREAELELTRERMEFALDATDSLIFEIDLDSGRETRHGPFERLYGIAPEDVPTTDAFYRRAVHPDDRAELERIQQEVVPGAGSETVEFEYRTHPGNGEVRWVWSLAYVQAGPDGAPERLVGLDTDVTDRKARERELERYEHLVEAVGDGIYVLDEDLAFSMVNDAMSTLTGYSREELLGRDFSTVVGTESTPVGSQARDQLLESDRTEQTVRAEVETAAGDAIPCEFLFTILPTETGVNTVGVVRDVSARIQREQRLERQNERLEEFVHIVSHDLRNPLMVAQNRLELAQADCGSEHLNDAGHALGRMESLIDDLLTLAREGHQGMAPEPVALAAVVEDCWRNVDTAAASLVVETEHRVRADPGQLKQLLENLVRNAVEHGSTSPRSHAPEDAIEHAGDDVTVTIGDLDDGFYLEDDGPGIPPEERRTVFESGYSTRENGTGFGLTIVAKIADFHGWDVAVTAGTRGGTRFEFTGLDELA